jgi:hypothetical protein
MIATGAKAMLSPTMSAMTRGMDVPYLMHGIMVHAVLFYRSDLVHHCGCCLSMGGLSYSKFAGESEMILPKGPLTWVSAVPATLIDAPQQDHKGTFFCRVVKFT